MRRGGRNLSFCLRELGYLKYIMYAVVIVISLFCGLNEILPLSVFETFEMFIFPLSGWWMIQEFYSYIDEDEREVFLSYPISRRYVGRLKYICTLLCFSIPVIVIMAFLVGEQSRPIFYLEMISESVFWISCGFFLIVFIRNIVISVGIVWIYASIQILDVSGSFRPISICYYFVDASAAPMKMAVLFAIAVVLYLVSQKKFKRMML